MPAALHRAQPGVPGPGHFLSCATSNPCSQLACLPLPSLPRCRTFPCCFADRYVPKVFGFKIHPSAYEQQPAAAKRSAAQQQAARQQQQQQQQQQTGDGVRQANGSAAAGEQQKQQQQQQSADAGKQAAAKT